MPGGIALLIALVTALMAALGWRTNYVNGLKQQARKDELDLVNKRLSDLYGPLYILCEAGKLLNEELLKKLGRKKSIFDEDVPPADVEVREWYHWMTQIMAPLNEQRLSLLLENPHLLVDDELPIFLLEMVTHIVGYRSLIKKWENGDYSDRRGYLPFPGSVRVYAKEEYIKLKNRQNELIRLIQNKDPNWWNKPVLAGRR